MRPVDNFVSGAYPVYNGLPFLSDHPRPILLGTPQLHRVFVVFCIQKAHGSKPNTTWDFSIAMAMNGQKYIQYSPIHCVVQVGKTNTSVEL